MKQISDVAIRDHWREMGLDERRLEPTVDSFHRLAAMAQRKADLADEKTLQNRIQAKIVELATDIPEAGYIAGDLGQRNLRGQIRLLEELLEEGNG